MKSGFIRFMLLVIVLLLVSAFYGYPSIMHSLPQGSHLWRQTYSMDMALNYKYYHLPFLQPEVSNLLSIDGKAAAEFPLLYFISAKCNQPEFALRLMHSILFIAGIIAAFYVAFHFLQDFMLSFFTAVLLFSSPLLVFYGNNFLTDVPALSITYIAWAVYLYAEDSKFKLLYYCCFFLLLSLTCLLKASQAINYGILAVLIIFQPNAQLKKPLYIFILMLTLLPIYWWYTYAKEYNIQNHHTYFFLGISPIWKLSWYDIGLTAWRILVSWSKSYFWRPTSIFLILCFFVYYKYRKRIFTDLHLFVISSFVFTVAYIILFYERLMKHEYYYITFYIFVLFWIVAVLYICKRFYGEIISWIKVFLVCLLLVNIIYCKLYTTEKQTDTYYNKNLASDEMQDFLFSKGVSQFKTLISIPDETPCQTLYFIKRKGYTEFNNYTAILKNRQADFLILADDTWKEKASLKPYLNDSIGNFHGITLYKLK